MTSGAQQQFKYIILTMTVQSIHIFDRRGKTIFSKSYLPKTPTEGKGDDEENDEEEQRKLIFGMLFSLREIATSLSPATNKGPQPGDDVEDMSRTKIPADLHLVKTGASTLYNYETVSGLRFALYTTAETSYGTSSILSQPSNISGGNPDSSIPSAPSSGGVTDSGHGGGSTAGSSGHGGSTGGGATFGNGITNMTNPKTTQTIRAALKHIYESIWVNCVVRSPMYHGLDNIDLSSTNFESTLDSYLKGMPWFR